MDINTYIKNRMDGLLKCCPKDHSLDEPCEWCHRADELQEFKNWLQKENKGEKTAARKIEHYCPECGWIPEDNIVVESETEERYCKDCTCYIWRWEVEEP